MHQLGAMYLEFLGYANEVSPEKWRGKDFESLRVIEAHLSKEKKLALQTSFAETQKC